MGFLFSAKKEKIIAIFDIGSGSVGGALVRVPLDGQSLPVILKSTRVDIVDREDLDFDLFLKDMILALGFCSHSLYQSKIIAPESIVCVLASPWYATETRIIKMEKENSFTFSKKTVNELINKEIISLNNVYSDKYGNINSIPEIIEHPIVNVFLNGYHVDNPLGVKTRSLEMNMIISESPKICLDKIRETLMSTYHSTPVSFSSFMVSSFVSIRDKYVTEDSYLIIDIGGEITDIGIVINGILKESLSFPYGRKTIYRDICNKMNIELRDAFELFGLFNNGVLGDKQANNLKNILSSIESTWVNTFKECVNTLPKTLTLPSIIFLTIDNDIKDWFKNIINKTSTTESLKTNKNITLITLEGSDLSNICSVESGVCDPFLMIEAISITRKLELYD